MPYQIFLLHCRLHIYSYARIHRNDRPSLLSNRALPGFLSNNPNINTLIEPVMKEIVPGQFICEQAYEHTDILTVIGMTSNYECVVIVKQDMIFWF